MITRRQLLNSAAAAAAAAVAFAPRLRAADAYTLPKLPYAVDALEPYIDAQTMQIHHDRHHQAYVDNLNKALAGNAELGQLSVEDLVRRLDSLPEQIRTAVRNQGGGHANHSLFWQCLTPAAKSGKPAGRLATQINADFGGQDKLEEALKSAAAGLFGSGWAWLSADAAGKLSVTTGPNQDSPLSAGRQPFLGIDVWEHAYYLKYQNRRPEYLAAIMHVVNWDFISQRYEEARKRG